MVEYLSGDHIIHRLVTSAQSEGEESTDRSESLLKPKLIIKKDEHGVVIHLDKSNSNSIKLFSKRGNEETFTLLAEVSGNQFSDTRPNAFNAPELREYMAYHVKDNVQVGPTSDIVLIIKK